MAINLADNNPRVVYSVAEGVTQTVFAVPFEFFEDADVNIYVDGVLKAEGTDYTLTGGEGATGTLTFVTAEPGETQQVTGAVGGSTVVLVRRIAIERTSDFQQGMDISRPALNTQLDVLTALVADMNDRWDRSVHLDDADTGQVNFVLPSSSVRAGNYFAFDANGDPVMTAGTTSTLVVSAFAETFLDDDTGAEVLNSLGVTASPAELNTLDGITASVSELNKLDGVTWTLTDYNTLTATAAELNQLDGITLGTGATANALPQATWEAGTSTTDSIVSPAKVKAAIEAIAGVASPVTEDPSGDASVVFLNLTADFYTFAFDSIQPDSSSDRQLFMDISADNGSSWTTTLAISSLANWQLNGGGSGALQFNTETITGFGALAYKSSGSTKTGAIVTPRYSTATIAANAVRFRWNTGNFRTLTGQRIIRYER